MLLNRMMTSRTTLCL